MGYGKQIRERRIALGMTQRELGKAIGKYHKRISEFENEEVRPDNETFALLHKHLGFFEVEPPQPKLLRPKKHLRRLRSYGRKGDRPTEARLVKAWHESTEQQRIVSLLSSKDRQKLELYGCDSLWEATVMAMLIVFIKVKLVGVRPLEEGFFEHVVLHPVDQLPAGHIRFPAFMVVWKKRRILLIPQVPVRAGGVTFTLDFLVGVRRKGGPCWLDLEFHGEGHNFSGDRFRQEALRMRTLRYGPDDIREPGFIEKMMDDILEATGPSILALPARQVGTAADSTEGRKKAS